MLKRSLAATLAACMMVLTLTACGDNTKTKSSSTAQTSSAVTSELGNNSGDNTSVTSTTSGSSSNASSVKPGSTSGSSSSTSTPITGLKRVKVWSSADDESILSAVSDYAKTNKKVDFNIITPAKYDLQSLKLAISAGSEPDIVMLDHVYITGLGRSKQLVDLAKLGANSIKSKYISSCWSGVTSGSSVFGLPHNGNTIALMYNKDMLDKTGLKAPKTYNDLVTVGQRMLATSKDKTPFTAPFFESADQGRLNWSAFEYFFWLWRNGGEILNSSYSKATFNSAAGIDALQKLIDLVKKYKVCNGSSYLESNFYNGDVGMIEMGCWALPELIKQDRNANFGVTMLPKLKSNVDPYSGLGLFAMGITAKSKVAPIAYDFLKMYTTTDSYQLQYAKQHNALPVTKTAQKDSRFKAANWQIYLQQFEKSKARPGVANWDAIEAKIAAAVTDAVQGKQTPRSALDAAAAAVNKLL